MALKEIVVDLRDITSIGLVCSKCNTETPVGLKGEKPPVGPRKCCACEQQYEEETIVAMMHVWEGCRGLAGTSTPLRLRIPDLDCPWVLNSPPQTRPAA